MKKLLFFVFALFVSTNLYAKSSVERNLAAGGGGGGAATSEPFVTQANVAGLTAERALTAVADETDLVDGGANSTITVGIVDPLIVGKGGTGAATLTDGGILLGSGTGAITPLGVAANGQIPIGDGTTDPVLATISAGQGVTITNAAGAITVASANGWQDAGDLVALNTSTDNVIVGGGTALGKVGIDGDTNEIQLQIQGFSTQTAGALVIEEDGGVDVFVVEAPDALSGTGNTMAGDAACDSVSTGTNNVCYGNNSGTGVTTASNTVNIGNDACSSSTAGRNICIGSSAGLNNTTGGGTAANANIYIGTSAGSSNETGTKNIYIGDSITGGSAPGTTNNVVIASGALASWTTADYLIGIGADIDFNDTGRGQIVIGSAGISTNAANQAVIGGAGTAEITDFRFGRGATDSTPPSITFQPTAATGANIAGGAFTIGSGRSTGLGASGVLNIAIASSDTISSSTLGTLTNIATFRNSSGVASFDITGVFRSTRTTDIGWSVVNAANQACNTTCVNACVFGMDTAALGNFLLCDNAASDTCICAGPT